jgi:hypothetical protein
MGLKIVLPTIIVGWSESCCEYVATDLRQTCDRLRALADCKVRPSCGNAIASAPTHYEIRAGAARTSAEVRRRCLCRSGRCAVDKGRSPGLLPEEDSVFGLQAGLATRMGAGGTARLFEHGSCRSARLVTGCHAGFWGQGPASIRAGRLNGACRNWPQNSSHSADPSCMAGKMKKWHARNFCAHKMSAPAKYVAIATASGATRRRTPYDSRR